ncbi:MAG: hypothetical protein SFU25_10630, partial [Candidatus Caenarcaniphilales bacterium]|nr:hypothetical protein [Candidatus Caenarcaniphilales bacterium]
QQIKDEQIKQQELQDQLLKEQQLKEQQIKDEQIKQQELQDQLLKEQQLKEQQIKDEQIKQQELQDQLLKEQEILQIKDISDKINDKNSTVSNNLKETKSSGSSQAIAQEVIISENVKTSDFYKVHLRPKEKQSLSNVKDVKIENSVDTSSHIHLHRLSNGEIEIEIEND